MRQRTVLEGTQIFLMRWPTAEAWIDAMNICRMTAGKEPRKEPPSTEFRKRLLAARHSPCRTLWFLFEIDNIPSWVATHLARHHVGIEKFVKSQRDDRTGTPRDKLPQDAPVDMVISINAEAMQTLANKRLCSRAHKSTRAVVGAMCELAEEAVPEFEGLLVPECVRHGGLCYEFEPCGRGRKWDEAGNVYRDERE